MSWKGLKLGYISTVDPSGTVPRQCPLVCRSVNMEWGFKGNRVAVIARHKCGKSDSQIFELLKPLKISRKFVCREVRRYKELWGVEDGAWSGRPRCVRNKAAIETVRERIRRNPLRKQNSLSREMDILPRSMSRLSRDGLHTRAYRRSKGVRVKTECDGTSAETRFGLPAKRTSPFISAGVSVQSSTGFLGVRVGGERL